MSLARGWNLADAKQMGLDTAIQRDNQKAREKTSEVIDKKFEKSKSEREGKEKKRVETLSAVAKAEREKLRAKAFVTGGKKVEKEKKGTEALTKDGKKN